MYCIMNNKQTIKVAESVRYIRRQQNGCYIVCGYDEREGINADGKIFFNEEFDDVHEFDGVSNLLNVSVIAREQARKNCVATNTPPSAQIGQAHYGAEQWEPGKAYDRYDLFEYNGSIGWVKQAHTSQEAWLPFAVGTEALYGARPIPDMNGVYPYVYNMAVEAGMLVRDGKTVYRCIQATNDLLYAPSQVPALFEVNA